MVFQPHLFYDVFFQASSVPSHFLSVRCFFLLFRFGFASLRKLKWLLSNVKLTLAHLSVFFFFFFLSFFFYIQIYCFWLRNCDTKLNLTEREAYFGALPVHILDATIGVARPPSAHTRRNYWRGAQPPTRSVACVCSRRQLNWIIVKGGWKACRKLFRCVRLHVKTKRITNRFCVTMASVRLHVKNKRITNRFCVAMVACILFYLFPDICCFFKSYAKAVYYWIKGQHQKPTCGRNHIPYYDHILPYDRPNILSVPTFFVYFVVWVLWARDASGAGAGIEFRGDDGCTALHDAAYCGGSHSSNAAL